jgi:hypothetical protein
VRATRPSRNRWRCVRRSFRGSASFSRS